MQEDKGELPAPGAQGGQAAPGRVKTKECRRLSLPMLYLLTFLPGLVHGEHPRAHSSRIISCLQELECYEGAWTQQELVAGPAEAGRQVWESIVKGWGWRSNFLRSF